MRNPYIVGRWLCGNEHYGRHRLLEYLIEVQDPAIWVVGTRRMGKTSLLRQLEWLTDRPDSPLVPLYWDLQGCETVDDLDYELFVSVEDKGDRFTRFGVELNDLDGMDAVHAMRTLQRALRKVDKRLFLLIDEAEALINVAHSDDQVLAKLRKVFQNGHQRTVMVATKSLMQLDDLNSHWLTSPFLFGINLVNLWSLDPKSSRALVLQEQAEDRIDASEAVVDEILIHTHRHPYLIQYLCYRLFESTGRNQGTLRAVEDEDLQADHLLSGFFRVDFDHLAPIERQILLTVARHGLISDETLCLELGELPVRIAMFTYGMKRLGYLRQVYSQWSIGNEFLRRWVVDKYDELVHDAGSKVTDQGVESLLVAGRQQERSYVQQELVSLQRKLDELLKQRAHYGTVVPVVLSSQIQKMRREMSILSEQLDQLENQPHEISS